jgi:hypothetical protein
MRKEGISKRSVYRWLRAVQEGEGKVRRRERETLQEVSGNEYALRGHAQLGVRECTTRRAYARWSASINLGE